MYDIFELNDKSMAELKEIALKLGVENVSVPKENLVYSIIEKQSAGNEAPAVEVKPKGRPGRPKKVVVEEKTPVEVQAEPEKPIENEPVKASEETPAEAPKRGRRPRIGKRTDVIKTTFENISDDGDKPHHVSYPKPRPAVVDVANEILNENNEEEPEMEIIAPAEEIESMVEEKQEVYEVRHHEQEEYQPQNHQYQPQNQQNQQQMPPKRDDLISEFDGVVQAEGVLEIMPDGYGFLRSADYNYLNSP